MTNVKFNKSKSADYAMLSGAVGVIYFTTDTHEIIVDKQSYGGSNYVLPAATSDSLGGVRLGFAQGGKDYPVVLDSNNKAYVNVPWTDTLYTLPVATSNALGGIKIGYTQIGKNYPVMLERSGEAYVNVPWIDTVPNNGKLSITGEGTTVVEFTADQSTGKTLNVKGVTGISVSGSNGQMIISSDSNHTVTSKTGIVEGGTEPGDQAYELKVVCDLSGETAKAVDINDFANLDYGALRTFTWSKSASEQNVYLGLFMIGSTSSGYAFKLDIQNTLTEKTESHLYGLLVDTPSDTTFAFVSTNSWPIICKGHLQDGNVLLAYLQVPDDFAGTIKLTPLKYRNGDNNRPMCFEPTSSSDNTPHYYNWVDDGEVNLSTYTSSRIYGNDITGTIRTPFGNYPVDIIGDFGGGIVVGSKVSDSIINDYFLHTLNKKVEYHRNW